ncbi:MAG TPA: diguanylate cyclase [Gallionella sp.]|nr:diguanylate cyclase [Gallionella sp.]
MTFNELSHDELLAVITQLKEALYNHQQWHAALIRTLVSKLPCDQRDINPDAHKECRFGQWYYGKSTEKIRNHPGFIAMGEEHQRMHQLASMLLIAADNGNPISTIDYDNFSNSLERLRLEISALEKELEELMFNRDPLTGAISRLSIFTALREQQGLVRRNIQSCCIAMMDLDKFKDVNDLHGHAAGDRVLTAAAQYLIRHLRPYDKLFRYGGEEFLLCIPHIELTTAYEVVNKLRQGLAALEINIGETEPIHVSASFGVTLLDPDIPVEASIDRADKAMYAAKSAGRNCVRIWESSM